MRKFFTLLFFIFMLNSVVFAGRGVEVPEYILVQMPNGEIKELELDEYLYGVVKSEMGLSYKASGMSKSAEIPMEALKAQAVASRSYAAYQISRASDDVDFHVTSTVSNQVYKEGNVDPRVKEAVDSTSGQIITYDDEVICAYFSSTSGGHTESSENVWSAALPYLRGVEDEYEIEVDNKSTWTAVYTQSDLQKIFPKLGTIEDIEIEDWSENDRVIELKIEGSKGSTTLTKNNMRMTMGTSKLRSQWFDVEFDGNEAVFEGRGFGHGVGMSQNGAIGMALEGFSYDEILTWYYTDVEIYGFDDYYYEEEEYDKYDEEYYIPEDEYYVPEEEEEIETPLLDRTIEICTTNWLLAILK